MAVGWGNSGGNIRDAWHLFKVRRALLTDPALSLSFGLGMFEVSIRAPQLREATASILYISAVSILDEAVKAQLAPEKRDNLKTRLAALHERGALLDHAALDDIRDRRNEIGHELEKEATVEELAKACDEIQRQLVVWHLVNDHPPYSIDFERSAVRGDDLENDRIVRVMNGADVVAELKQRLKVESPIGQTK